MAFTTGRFIFFLLNLFPLLVLSQNNNGTISVGGFLTAADNASPWLSHGQNFGFGFRKLDKEDLYLLSIWFHQIPASDETIVWWSADEDGKPMLAPAGSKIELTANNGLLLTNPEGQKLWSTSFPSSKEVAYAVMNDTGNFVIKTDRDSETLWQSFDHPTDTLLPTQVMNINDHIFSRKKVSNFSRGKFLLRLLEDGNLVLSTVNLPSYNIYDSTYYRSNTNDTANVSNSGSQLVFSESDGFYVLRKNGERFQIGTGATLPTPTTNYYHRVTLDFDGVIAQYSYLKTSSGNGSWSTVWTKPQDICVAVGDLGSGVCGFNSLCIVENGRPTCKCPTGLSLLDPEDTYGSCKWDIELGGCQDDVNRPMEDLYRLEQMVETNWPSRSDSEYYASFSEEECKTSCLSDCMCAVAIYGRSGCWKKKLPLSNGRVRANEDAMAFIKVRRGNAIADLPNPVLGKKNNVVLIAIGSALLGTSVFVNLTLIGVICFSFLFINRKRFTRTDQGGLETNVRRVTYKQVAEATNNFTEELGRGAFGIVYKGAMRMTANGSKVNVAVKKLNIVIQDDDKEFQAEINVIGKTHHKNLVRLLGICEEREHRMLVYEFLSNGALADYLFGHEKPSWKQRTQIALGIARGLMYLHEECNTQIIHCDIKPQNILLDDYYNPQISDFGLSKLLRMDQTQTKTAIRGTKGYVAPEWFRNLPVTVKVDVYSFGVLLLEIICCRKSVEYVEEEEMDGSEENSILTYWAYDCYREGTVEELVEDDMEAKAMDNRKSLELFLKVAFWCIQEDPYLRPTMRKVTQMLEGVVQAAIPPNPSPFTIFKGN